jgi:hypothetical protein
VIVAGALYASRWHHRRLGRGVDGEKSDMIQPYSSSRSKVADKLVDRPLCASVAGRSYSPTAVTSVRDSDIFDQGSSIM